MMNGHGDKNERSRRDILKTTFKELKVVKANRCHLESMETQWRVIKEWSGTRDLVEVNWKSIVAAALLPTAHFTNAYSTTGTYI
jgi:hypothetical protein